MKFKPKLGYCKDFFGKKYCVRQDRCENAIIVKGRVKCDGIKHTVSIPGYGDYDSWAGWSSKAIKKGEVRKVEDVLEE